MNGDAVIAVFRRERRAVALRHDAHLVPFRALRQREPVDQGFDSPDPRPESIGPVQDAHQGSPSISERTTGAMSAKRVPSRSRKHGSVRTSCARGASACRAAAAWVVSTVVAGCPLIVGTRIARSGARTFTANSPTRDRYT